MKRKRFRFLRGAKKTADQLRLLWDALKKFGQDHGFLLSSGIAFELLICLIPLILLFLALIGTCLYSDREILSHIRRYLESSFPSLDPKMMRSLLSVIRNRKIAGVLGFGGLLWTSTWVFSSLRTALNIIFGVKKERGFFHGKTIDLLMIFSAGVFLLMSMALTSMITFVQQVPIRLPLEMGPILQFLLKYLVPFFFAFGMFFLIYKIVPNRRIRFKTAFHTALFTTLLWEGAKQVLSWYVLRAGRFSMVYGSLGALAIFFLWVYYSAAIVLLGGEVASLIERRKDSYK